MSDAERNRIYRGVLRRVAAVCDHALAYRGSGQVGLRKFAVEGIGVECTKALNEAEKIVRTRKPTRRDR